MKNLRWVFVDPFTDEETDYSEPPTNKLTLKVETIGARERTWTRHHAETGARVQPRGEGWVFESEDKHSSSWTRERTNRAAAAPL